MKITVTQEHIKNGKKYIASLCPIALALKDKGEKNALVGAFDIVLFFKGKHFRYSLPLVAQDFILKFDSGKRVKPFSFEAKKI